MAQYEPGVEMIAAENRSGWLQSELVDVAVFGLFFVLSALFVIMAGYFVMAWL
ncbi:hypothetical protein [Sulfobacillus thermosulfidooxidans]|uniref:Uncharacterized protein n=1 Tax=Sulfobacillus thermosulfidooxidans (strain DSM 9293 / VKM B-1269 / AT-1) TaxID=929705 RepID=A0A1W1WJ63_SULTA|nr:hypothetical protein [Sulfobacillus thermosulfidooxidans]SMC06307.1 hypothetical protein SAMN00768000_2745 [Sulfobacillus thermosulfidooxidans DSM 9293]